MCACVVCVGAFVPVLFVCVCASVLFQGYLIANHLPKEDLLDVCLYCQHYCLMPLAAEQRVGQLVVWREVFPRHRAQDRDQNHRPGYLQPHGRYFLLIVGLVRTFIVKAFFALFDIVYCFCPLK